MRGEVRSLSLSENKQSQVKNGLSSSVGIKGSHPILKGLLGYFSTLHRHLSTSNRFSRIGSELYTLSKDASKNIKKIFNKKPLFKDQTISVLNWNKGVLNPADWILILVLLLTHSVTLSNLNYIYLSFLPCFLKCRYQAQYAETKYIKQNSTCLAKSRCPASLLLSNNPHTFVWITPLPSYLNLI